MKKTIFSQLESSALFAGLDANSIEKHLSMIQYSVKKVPAKTIFFIRKRASLRNDFGD